MIYCNPLENEQDTQEYKKWLDTKHIGFLRHLVRTFKLPPEYRSTAYPNLPLRIKLVEEAISKRLN